uniref:Uncharacterized protein n=1 Tax=viral metagenome TaxID=1070528 RepID=A0A6C0JR86_9ZZZZ
MNYNYLMTLNNYTNEQVLKICSKCKIEVLLLHFNINRKGDHYKIRKKYQVRQNKYRLKCQHGRQRNKCGGSAICTHNRFKRQCKECDGASICEHDRLRVNCIDYGGSRFCKHDKRKYQCCVCSPHRSCKLCCHVCSPHRSRFKSYCFQCYCVLNPDDDVPTNYSQTLRLFLTTKSIMGVLTDVQMLG